MKKSSLASVMVLVATAAGAVAGLAQFSLVRELSTGGYANAISAGIAGGSVGNHAAVWSPTGVVDLNPEGYTFSTVSGRSGPLSVGYAGTGSLAQAPIVWQGSSAATLPVPFAYVIGRAVATDGVQIVGSATEGDPERGVGSTHALLWNVVGGTAVDLGDGNAVYGVGGGVQVGTRTGSQGATAGLWRGAATSFVDLHVRPYDVSVACDTSGPIQVGYLGIDVRVRNEARPRDIRFYSAGYWSGTAASFTFLSSPYRHSFATAIKGDTIIGYGNTTDAIGTPRDSHAVAWVGDLRTYADLHAMLPADMRTSRATAVDEFGNIVGYGVTTTGVVRSYVWLRRPNSPLLFEAAP